jgi:hypothetical protein
MGATVMTATVIAAGLLTPWNDAVTCVLPGSIAVSKPVLEIVATVVLLLVHTGLTVAEVPFE